MKLIKAIAFSILTGGLFLLLQDFPAPQIPFSVGAFFNPFSGFWQNGEEPVRYQETLAIAGLQEPVVVIWDDRRVPHIFAQNDYDLYFVQGYLTARHRLWQMEFITFVASGRLAEILGDKPGIVAHDRFRRRTGMVYAAENALASMQTYGPARVALDAYTAGVNRWIAGLSEATLPLEYKILHYQPEIWTPLKSALLLKYMAWDLCGRNDEVLKTRLRAALGDAEMTKLFPSTAFRTETIIPPQTRWSFRPVSAPAPPESLFMPESLVELPAPLQSTGSADNGSNNWVVSGKKTASGRPILCNDPHLGLNLPCIWYENQLVSPNVNVYGVSLPGAPGVIIGFNKHIAWGVTNAATDVMDWYQVRFRDKNADAYWYDGQWRPVNRRIEAIKIRGKPTVFDTIPMTHHGPVAYRENEHPLRRDLPLGAALRWVPHDASNELRAFWLLNRAKNYADFVEALAHYDAPAQNFVFASVDGDIALHHNGKFPLRWPGQGAYLSDGSDPTYEWDGFIPREHIPKVLNPRQGFLQSANQNPVTERYPYYLHGNYATFERGRRIHERLSEMSNITPEDMMQLQLDNLNLRARTVLPTMLAALDTARLTAGEMQVYHLLEQWDYQNRRDARAPIVFEAWWDEALSALWDDDLPADSLGVILYPEEGVSMQLLCEDTASVYFDRRDTPERESYAAVMQQSYQSACRELITRLGPPGDRWRWGAARGTDIRHLARIPGLGRMGLPTDGNYAIVNATRKYGGPSWRMVVALGNPPQAWGVYPGGQWGNPGSAAYDQFVDKWLAGQYYELLYLSSAKQLHERLVGKTLLQPAN